ncbi:MAG: Serine/threonine-protein kinase PknD [Phycisphaerae bacterium]|nr:Serine/threonine-protein kinase PknD [Phycisphaerae bacterium]
MKPDPMTDAAVYEKVLEAPPPERRRLLETLGLTPDRIERLMQRLTELDRREAEGFMRVPAFQRLSRDAERIELPTPRTIGPYRILKRLGAGAFGVVYEAQQDHPSRVVALKLAHASLSDAASYRGFRREIRLLASIEHENVARVLEAGTLSTEHGEFPYFTMDRVQGAPLLEYLVRVRPALHDLLRLFLDVCRAAAHAHARGVIHRDLKPSHILVTTEGKPKLIDFGIARALEPDEDATQTITATGLAAGTPAYMRPERFRTDSGFPDVGDDVYALGVILYQAISGSLPFDAPADDVFAVMEQKRLDPIPLLKRAPKTPTDLALIVHAAIDPDPKRRYPTVQSLADDVERFLDQRPIEARPANAFYNFRRLVRRHVAWFTASTTFGAFLIVLSVVLFLQTQRLTLSETRSRRSADALDATMQAVTRWISTLDPTAIGASLRPWRRNMSDTDLGREIIRQVVTTPIVKILDEGTEASAMDVADFYSILAISEHQQGQFKPAESYADQAWEVIEHLDSDDIAPRHLRVLQELFSIYGNLHQFDKAIAAKWKSLEFRRILSSEVDAEYIRDLNRIAFTERARGRLDESEKLHFQALDLALSILGRNHEYTMETYSYIGLVYKARTNTELAATWLNKGLDSVTSLRGRLSDTASEHSLNIGGLYREHGFPDRAIPYFQEAVDIRAELHGDADPYTSKARNMLALALSDLGRIREAVDQYTCSLESHMDSYGWLHPETLQVMHNLGLGLRKSDQLAESYEMLLKALKGRRQVLGEDHPTTMKTTVAFALTCSQSGRSEEALNSYAIAMPRYVGDDALWAGKGWVYCGDYAALLIQAASDSSLVGPALEAADDLGVLRQCDLAASSTARDRTTLAAALAELCLRADREDDAARWSALTPASE